MVYTVMRVDSSGCVRSRALVRADPPEFPLPLLHLGHSEAKRKGTSAQASKCWAAVQDCRDG